MITTALLLQLMIKRRKNAFISLLKAYFVLSILTFYPRFTHFSHSLLHQKLSGFLFCKNLLLCPLLSNVNFTVWSLVLRNEKVKLHCLQEPKFQLGNWKICFEKLIKISW